MTTKVVPVIPTEPMWGGLARDIIFWMRTLSSTRPNGSSMYAFLRKIRPEIPEWLLEEIPDTDVVPPKGTVAAVIYRAMVEEAPEPPHSIKTNELLEAAKTLVSKLDQINDDPAFVGVFQMASIHGAPYGGPSWVSELDALRTAISNAEKAI